MPIILFLFGAIFLAAAMRGDACDGEQCYKLLFSTLKDDFTGDRNFFYWVLAIFVVGGVGYYKPLRPFSNAFMLLIILVLLLANGDPRRNSNGGFFAALPRELRGGQ